LVNVGLYRHGIYRNKDYWYCLAVTEPRASGDGLTIDELARQLLIPVRTIREYHTMRLLPPPVRRGRVGIYGPAHVKRLELIARLQRRGYSLAGIRDLLEAWDAGSDLTSLLGVGPGQAALDETPLRLTRAELSARLPGLTGDALNSAREVGLITRAGDEFVVRSPALLALATDGVKAGVPVSDMLDLVGILHREVTVLASLIAEHIAGRLLPAMRLGQDAGDLAQLLQRGRLLLLQGTASTLADRLGAAIVERTDRTEGGAALRAAFERIRVKAVADSAGRIHPWR
jgi:DNA-binding transcriptional MerR regulator